MIILVATQSEVNCFFTNNEVYKPIIVGAKNCNFKNKNYLSDNVGDNISEKNPYYCELTALYWGWKHISSDFIGLCHYRRFFLFRYKSIFNLDRLPIRNFSNSFLGNISVNKKQLCRIFCKYDVVVPKPKKLYLSVREDYYYDKVCFKKDFLIMEQVVLEKYPEYKDSVNAVFDGHIMYHFNMFIMNRKNFQSYMTWLFDVLSECEKRIDILKYSKVEARVLGFLSERLFGLYLHHNKLHKYELTVGYVNSYHRIFNYFNFESFRINEFIYYLMHLMDKYFRVKK